MKDVTPKDRRYVWIAVLAIVALFFSIVVLIQKTTDNHVVEGFCSAVGNSGSCMTVQNSVYGKIFGVDNPWYGIIGFTLLAVFAVLAFIRTEEAWFILTITGTTIAGLLAVWFLYLQAFVLGAYCVYCVVVDIVSIILLAIGISFVRR